MLGIKEIFSILDSQEIETKTEKTGLKQGSGRFLTETVRSSLDSPPFDKAAMDGWAVCGGDEEGPWDLIETLAAGDVAALSLTPGKCSAIMTGAKIPKGCGKIIRIEYTRREKNRVFLVKKEPLKNIIFRGENLKSGEQVLTPRRLSPVDIGILASLGLAEIKTAAPPRIGIITTGSELREPGEHLGDGEIYNSNGLQLSAQSEEAGCPVTNYGIIVDDRKSLLETVQKGLKENDILLLSGGVSMGEFDFVPGVLEDQGVRKSFHKAAIKPGKPLWFGRNDSCFVFGLPGNPVSTYILFEVFVKHLIYRFCGLEYKPDFLRAILGKTINRKTWDRSEFLPVQFREEHVFPVAYNGSSHLNALAEATGLVIIPAGVKQVDAGEVVHVRLL